MNHDIDFYEYILKLDKYNYHMMNIIDYLIGNNDRHPNNWGVLIDNKTNKILKLYSLMDFNKAFKNYNNISGGRCLTTKESMSQMEAAVEAVKDVGLNLKRSIQKSIFDGSKAKDKMFYARLNRIKHID